MYRNSSIKLWRWWPWLMSCIRQSDWSRIRHTPLHTAVLTSKRLRIATRAITLRFPPYPCGPSTTHLICLISFSFYPPPYSAVVHEVPNPPLPPTNVRSSSMSACLKLFSCRNPFTMYTLNVRFLSCKFRSHFPVHMAGAIIFRRAHFAAAAGH